MNEDQWIAQVRNSNLESFNRLVLTYQDEVFRLALYILGNEQDAEDATRETFLIAYNMLRSRRCIPFRIWLIRIAANTCTKHLGCEGHNAFLVPTRFLSSSMKDGAPAWPNKPDDHLEDLPYCEDSPEIVQKALMQIPVTMRAAVVLVDILQLDYGATGFVLSFPVEIVKRRISEGRRRVRDILHISIE